MIGLDFETNGYSHRAPCVPIEIGLVELLPDGTIRVIADALMGGATWVTRAAYQTHGIRLNDCRYKPGYETYRAVLQEAVLKPICVHAKGTERKILEEKYGIKDVHWIDTLTLSRRELKNCPNHQLATVTKYLGLEEKLRQLMPNVPQRRWHRAAYDAAASLLIAKELNGELNLA